MRKQSIIQSDPVIALILAVSFVVASFTTNVAQAATPAVSASSSSPAQPSATGNLVFEESFYDFGKVTEGDIVKHTFKFRNAGAGAMKIIKNESSCGCTSTNNVLKEYAPGDQGEIEAVVDTVGKKGVVVKTLTLTMGNNKVAKTELSMAMHLVPPPHPVKAKLSNLNTDPVCKTCHLDSAQGQTGIFLYHRVCAQCHGKKGVGASAMAFTDANWQNGTSDAHLKQRIHEGLTEVGMPSFVKGVTPPLNRDFPLGFFKVNK